VGDGLVEVVDLDVQLGEFELGAHQRLPERGAAVECPDLGERLDGAGRVLLADMDLRDDLQRLAEVRRVRRVAKPLVGAPVEVS
jgi:hypothetical protein